jgi:hypothetical protein
MGCSPSRSATRARLITVTGTPGGRSITQGNNAMCRWLDSPSGTALAASRWIEAQARWSIRKFPAAPATASTRPEPGHAPSTPPADHLRLALGASSAPDDLDTMLAQLGLQSSPGAIFIDKSCSRQSPEQSNRHRDHRGLTIKIPHRRSGEWIEQSSLSRDTHRPVWCPRLADHPVSTTTLTSVFAAYAVCAGPAVPDRGMDDQRVLPVPGPVATPGHRASLIAAYFIVSYAAFSIPVPPISACTAPPWAIARRSPCSTRRQRAACSSVAALTSPRTRRDGCPGAATGPVRGDADPSASVVAARASSRRSAQPNLCT